MTLRPSLVYKRRSRSHRKEIKRLVLGIIEILDEEGDASREIARLNELTGPHYHPYDEEFFFEFWSHSSEEELVEQIAGPATLYVPDLAREELVDIVVRASKSSHVSAEYDYYCDLFDRNVAMIYASSLIPSRERLEDPNGGSEKTRRTPEEIVDLATDPKHVLICGPP